VYFLAVSIFWGSNISFVGDNEFLMTGTDSPVNMLSLTIHDPVNRTTSHGIKQLFGTTITSPGTSSLLDMVLKEVLLFDFDYRLTSTSHS